MAASRAPRWMRRLGLAVAALLLLIGGTLGSWIAATVAAAAHREARAAQAMAGPRSHWTQTPDATLHWQSWGPDDAPAVLLVHGTGAWSGTWFDLPDTLVRAGWRVVAVDLPPFGLSTARRPEGFDYGRAAQARRLLAVIDALPGPPVVVGHSFGAGPALEAALTGAQRTRGLVLVDPALGLGADGSPPSCTPSDGGLLAEHPALRTTAVRAVGTVPMLAPTLLRQFVHRTEVVTDDLVRPYRIPFRRTRFSADLGDWALAFSGSACEPALSLRPEALTRWSAGYPAVGLIWGAQDTITPLAQARSLTTWLKGSALDVIDDVGHIPHIEAPQPFAERLTAQLGRLR